MHACIPTPLSTENTTQTDGHDQKNDEKTFSEMKKKDNKCTSDIIYYIQYCKYKTPIFLFQH